MLPRAAAATFFYPPLPPGGRRAWGRTGRRAEEEGRFVAQALAGGHRWKAMVFVYSYLFDKYLLSNYNVPGTDPGLRVPYT